MRQAPARIVLSALRWLYRLATNRLPPEQKQSLGALRPLLVRYRYLQALFMLTYLLVGIFECGSMALLAVVLQLLMTGGNAAPGEGTAAGAVGWLRESLGQDQLVMTLLGGAIVLQLLRSGLHFASESLGATLQARATAEIRGRLVRRFLGLEYEEFGRYKLGRLQSYFEHPTHIGQLLQLLDRVVAQIAVIAAYVVVLLWLSGIMTAAALVFLVVLSWPVGRVLRRVQRAGRAYISEQTSLSEHVTECLQAFRLVHSFGLRGHVIAQSDARFQSCARAYRRKIFWSSLVSPLFETVCVGGGLALLLAGYWLARGSGGQVVAELVGYTVVLYRLMPRVSHVNQHLAAMAAFWPSVQRLAPYLVEQTRRTPARRRRPVPASWEEVRFEGVSFQHRTGNREAVSQLSFTLPRQSMTAIVGTSGAGKSTLANLLLRFYEPTAGRILVGETDLLDIDREAWRARVGMVDQDGFLFHASVRDNIRHGKLDATDAEVQRAAEAAGAHEFIARLPAGYDTVMGDRGHRLSGGQRQRLAIARALIRDPETLILDEATSSLDTRSERLIQQSIERLRGDRTVIVIAHRLSTVVMADQILVLDRGRLIECGTHEQLLAANGQYAQLWRLQSETPREPPGDSEQAA